MSVATGLFWVHLRMFLFLFLRRLCWQLFRKLSPKTEHCIHCYETKILHSVKSLGSSKLSPYSFSWASKPVFVLKNLLALQEIKCWGSQENSYIFWLFFKTRGEVSKQLWASINHLIGQKKFNGSINHNCYDTENSVHIRCNGTSQCHKARENQVCWFSSEMYTVCYYSFSSSSTITNLFILSHWKEQFLVFKKRFLFPKATSHP